MSDILSKNQPFRLCCFLNNKNYFYVNCLSLQYLNKKLQKMLINVVAKVTSINRVATSLHFDLKISSIWKPGGKRLRTSPASHHFPSSSMVQQLPPWMNPGRSVREQLYSHQLCSLGSHHQLQQESCVFGAVINVQTSTALSEMYLSD